MKFIPLLIASAALLCACEKMPEVTGQVERLSDSPQNSSEDSHSQKSTPSTYGSVSREDFRRQL